MFLSCNLTVSVYIYAIRLYEVVFLRTSETPKSMYVLCTKVPYAFSQEACSTSDNSLTVLSPCGSATKLRVNQIYAINRRGMAGLPHKTYYG